jgi:hypothetical protein
MPLGQKAWVPGQEGLQPGIPSSPGRSRSFVHGDLADEESDLMEPWEAGSAGRTCCSLTSPRSVRAGCLLLSTAQDVLGAAVFKCVCVCVYTRAHACVCACARACVHMHVLSNAQGSQKRESDLELELQAFANCLTWVLGT